MVKLYILVRYPLELRLWFTSAVCFFSIQKHLNTFAVYHRVQRLMLSRLVQKDGFETISHDFRNIFDK